MAARAKIDIYYKKLETSPLYALAVILDPQCRTRYIHSYWPKESGEKCIRAAKAYWERFLQSKTLPEEPPVYDETLPARPNRRQRQKETAYDKIKSQRQQQAEPKDLDEFETYIADFATHKDNDILNWWLQDAQKERWPSLSELAYTILCIPAMSDEPERVFSLGRRTVRWDRARLTVETLNMLECLKDWERSLA
jgi:hypothetical protein